MTTKTGDKTKAQIIADSNVDKVQWNKNLGFHSLKAIHTAEEFVPSVAGNWSGAPVTQDAALNELGARANKLLTDAANADKVLVYATTTGVPTIAQIYDKNIHASAAIATSKLAAATQIGYLSLGGTITTGGTWTQTGAHTVGITTTGNTTITLPQTGTLATLAGAETFSGAKTFSVLPVIDNDIGIKFNELTANGTNYVLVKPAASLAADYTVTLPSATGTLALTTDIGADVRATATVSLSQGDIQALAASPKQLVAAPSAGQVIVVENIEILHTYSTTQYADGGACKIQYDSTATGGGTKISGDLATMIKAAATSNLNHQLGSTILPVTAGGLNMADSTIVAKGVFLSTDTGEFTAGHASNVLKIRITYRVITAVS